jgi:hypothetical protein
MDLHQEIIVTTDRATHESLQSARKQSLGETLEVAAFRLLGSRLWYKSYILLSSLRSCLGHIRTQLARDRVEATQVPSQGFHHPLLTSHKRIIARKQGIKKLQAIHPWMDRQDLQMFLAGFDAGELWAFDSLGNTPRPGQD